MVPECVFVVDDIIVQLGETGVIWVLGSSEFTGDDDAVIFVI